MVETIIIYDKLTCFNIFKFYFKKDHKIFFLKNNFISRIYIFFNLKKISHLKWDLYQLKENNKKIITSIREDHQVDKFVYDFLDNFFIKENNHLLDKNFYHYLVKSFSNQKNLISFLSIENFLILHHAVGIIFNKNKIKIYLCDGVFADLINQKYNNNNISFEFYKKLFNLSLVNYLWHLLKLLGKSFSKKKVIDSYKSICVMDSYEINKPDNFFYDIPIDEIALVSTSKFAEDKRVINIYNTVRLKFFFVFFKIFLKYKSFYKKNKFINLFFLEFLLQKEIFLSFFKNTNIKLLFTSFIAQNYTSSAIAAIHELKGISVGFTGSYSEKYSSHLNIDAFDHFLSFNASKHIFRNFSNLKKISSLGYLGDYKFKSIQEESLFLRLDLQKKGAKYIVGFFDQGSTADTLYCIGHEPSRSGYEFLLKKIISNPEFGLIIKPKKPKLLKEKLGKVYDILLEAQATKRCIVFENFHPNHVKNFKDIPAKIALASDLTIHDTLLAGTAGLESALCSKKSIFFDYYHSTKSLFLDKKLNIVYKDWDLLWEQIMKDSNGISGSNFGNWSSIIDQFDAYRDGKTNIRICSFLKNIQNNSK